MNRFLSGGGKLFSRAIIYSATFSFIGINFFTFSHHIKHSYWDNLHSSPVPSSGQYMQPPEEITNSSKEEKLFYTLKSNNQVSSSSEGGVKKLLIFSISFWINSFCLVFLDFRGIFLIENGNH